MIPFVDFENCLNVDGNVYVEAALLKQLAYFASDLIPRLDAERNDEHSAFHLASMHPKTKA
jgi:hypothetical protein